MDQELFQREKWIIEELSSTCVYQKGSKNSYSEKMILFFLLLFTFFLLRHIFSEFAVVSLLSIGFKFFTALVFVLSRSVMSLVPKLLSWRTLKSRPDFD